MKPYQEPVREFAFNVIGVIFSNPLFLLRIGFLADARSHHQHHRYFLSVKMELIPNVSDLHVVFLNPTFLRMFSKSIPSGNASTDSGRYVYADLSFEIKRPKRGNMFLK